MQALHHALSHIEQQVPRTFYSYAHMYMYTYCTLRGRIKGTASAVFVIQNSFFLPGTFESPTSTIRNQAVRDIMALVAGLVPLYRVQLDFRTLTNT